ncbi:MAG: hypothetical protein KAR20_25195 [Candidatus Heimdallarchaeota archaeon]|nr:hypothetical protein [Candidatus Heimdallarchaeota archaeon]
MKRIFWKGERLTLIKRLFQTNGTMTVFLIDDTKFPLVTVNLNVSSVILQENEIIVNDFGQNEGIKQVLIEAGFLHATGNWVQYENELCEICRVT